MGDHYWVGLSRGAIRLFRTWEWEREGDAPARGGGGTNAGQRGPSTAGRTINGFSKRARQNMRLEFAGLPWEMLGDRPAMVTLTMPGDWQRWCPDARTLAKMRDSLKRRWTEKWGAPTGVWIVEFQTRGAPHLHLYVGLPEAMSDDEYRELVRAERRRKREEVELGRRAARDRVRAPGGPFGLWLRDAWWKIVGSGSAAHHGRGVRITPSFWTEGAQATLSRERLADYFWRESGKWGQKQAPEGFGGLRYWGRWGEQRGFKASETVREIDARESFEMRRVLVGLVERKLRKVGLRYKGPRGRDGMTAFVDDAPMVLMRLHLWAAEVVRWKGLGEGAGAAAERERGRGGGGRRRPARASGSVGAAG